VRTSKKRNWGSEAFSRAVECRRKQALKETLPGFPTEDLPVDFLPAFVEGFWSAEASANAFHHFLQTLDWRQDTLVLFGRRVLQPRLVAFHADEGVEYSYSGHTLPRAHWTPLLCELKEHVEAQCESRFNSVLCNLYRNGDDSMGWHSDDEKSLGPRPLIASVTLGASRTFTLRRKDERARRFSFELAHGSLLVMKDNCQAAWQHAIPKTKKNVGARLNFTFRNVVTAKKSAGGSLLAPRERTQE
jgi:alkylated DNA repair dioxygenase AlkB